MNTIRVHVNLYGSLARFGGGHYVSDQKIELPLGASKNDLLDCLQIPSDERGYLFVNAVLCDVPGLQTGPGVGLKDGDHVGIFSVDRLWPYQYRDGVRMSEDLTILLAAAGPMHHSYNSPSGS